MRAAMEGIIERDYTQVITDVFDGDSHSPLNFYTRVCFF